MTDTQLKGSEEFSFRCDWKKLKHLSIFQAIAYILHNEANLIPIEKMYIECIDKYELSVAQKIYESSPAYRQAQLIEGETEYVMPKVERDFIIDNYIINPWVGRINLIEEMGAPVTIIYFLLESEINQYKSNKDASSIIAPKNIGGHDEFYFKRLELKKWQSLPKIKEFSSLDPNQAQNVKRRMTHADNRKKITGMLVQLLANQPLTDRYGNPAIFVKGEDADNINFSGIYKYFKENYLDEEYEVDKELRTFPAQRTVTDYLSESFDTFKKFVDARK